jgi:hypothetical protein
MLLCTTADVIHKQTAARKEMCRLFGDVIAARRKEGAAAAEGKARCYYL